MKLNVQHYYLLECEVEVPDDTPEGEVMDRALDRASDQLADAYSLILRAGMQWSETYIQPLDADGEESGDAYYIG